MSAIRRLSILLLVSCGAAAGQALLFETDLSGRSVTLVGSHVSDAPVLYFVTCDRVAWPICR